MKTVSVSILALGPEGLSARDLAFHFTRDFII